LKEALYIFIGSGLGGLTRFGLGKWVNSFHSTNFPFGTFAVNIAACFVLGFVIGLADTRQLISPQTKMFWVVGFCGGFSTFSTFSNETLTLLQSGNHSTNFIYISASVILCLGFTFFGLILANKI
jgi:CrcB protein